MKSCLIGILSWCDSARFPKRFVTFQQSVDSLKKYISRNNCTIVVLDNNSSSDVKQFIKQSSVFDIKILLPENIHDTGALAVLAKVCQDQRLSYFFPLDNDHVFYRRNFLSACLTMLEDYPQCGYVRLLKFDYKTKDLFDKAKKRLTGHNYANAVWMYNLISGRKLIWEGPLIRDKCSFYINNWHWASCGPLVRLNLWQKLFPPLKGLLPVYHDLERYMRNNYQQLGLKTIVLDGGAFAQEDSSVYKSSFTTFKNKLNSLLFFKASNNPTIPATKVIYYRNNYHRFIS